MYQRLAGWACRMRWSAAMQRKRTDWPGLLFAEIGSKQMDLLIVSAEVVGQKARLEQVLAAQMVRFELVLVDRRAMPGQVVADQMAMLWRLTAVQTVMMSRLVGHQKEKRPTELTVQRVRSLQLAVRFARRHFVRRLVCQTHSLAVPQRLADQIQLSQLVQTLVRRLVSALKHYQHLASMLGQIQTHQKRVYRKHHQHPLLMPDRKPMFSLRDWRLHQSQGQPGRGLKAGQMQRSFGLDSQAVQRQVGRILVWRPDQRPTLNQE